MQTAQRHLRLNLSELRQFSDRALQLVLQTPSKSKTQLQGPRRRHSRDDYQLKNGRIAPEISEIEGATDVITFQHGEIFVSVETAQRQAARFEAEIKLYIVHGLLHLHGFDDRTPAKLRSMEAAQKRIQAAAL